MKNITLFILLLIGFSNEKANTQDLVRINSNNIVIGPMFGFETTTYGTYGVSRASIGGTFTFSGFDTEGFFAEDFGITTEIRPNEIFFNGNLTISELGNENLGLENDIIPLTSTGFDLGNNTAGENWDDVVAVDFVNFSDKNVKQGIKNLRYGLQEILQLEPVQFKYNFETKDHNEHLGLIAQEVLEVVPEIVKTHDIDIVDGLVKKEKVEILGMNYVELVPVLIHAIQEQHELFESEKAKNEVLLSRIERLEALLQIEERSLEQDQEAYILQNQPNPFSTNTIIQYFIPSTTKNASLLITDLSGKLVKQQEINHTGSGKTTIDADSLSSGIYLYTIVFDRKALPTKQMVISR
ncbi:MAG: tail fiber domain-containing protein [Bacteroidota bacterium]